MAVKVTGILTETINYPAEKGTPVEVEIDLDDISAYELETYVRAELGMVDEWESAWLEEDCTLDDFDTDTLIDYIESIGYRVKDSGEYSSLRQRMAYEKLFDNMGNIPVEKIEELVKDL